MKTQISDPASSIRRARPTPRHGEVWRHEIHGFVAIMNTVGPCVSRCRTARGVKKLSWMLMSRVAGHTRGPVILLLDAKPVLFLERIIAPVYSFTNPELATVFKTAAEAYNKAAQFRFSLHRCAVLTAPKTGNGLL